MGEDSSQTIKLVDADGAFLQVDVPAEDGSHSETDVEAGNGIEDDEGLRTQLEETRARNEVLEREVSELN